MKKFLPILLAIVIFLILVAALHEFILLLNLFPIKDKIIPGLFIADVLVGLTIYLKTSVDFALFIGNLMSNYSGWKNRIAIESGTAIGNATGTFLVLFIWTFFKEIPLLIIVMVFVAALVLFTMSQEGLESFLKSPTPFLGLRAYAEKFLLFLTKINTFFSPLTNRLLPHSKTNAKSNLSFYSLLIFSFTIPFVLGLDDFAGYIPLFSIVNVFGFSTGVFLGHMLLNISLFASPKTTIKIVKFPVIQLIGSMVFFLLGMWGLVEATRILLKF